MKRYLIPLLAAGVLCAVAGIDWTFHSKPIWQLKVDSETVELGLRDDGVVVWRKITQTTNSPAEEPGVFLLNPKLTNIWMWTNEIGFTNNPLNN